MNFNTSQELQEYLNEVIQDVGAYALVNHNGITESVWFANMGTTFNQSDSKLIWFLEAPNQLYTYPCEDEKSKKFNIELGNIIRDDKAYEIISWQCAPFLNYPIDDLKLISEEECLDYLLKKEGKRNAR